MDSSRIGQHTRTSSSSEDVSRTTSSSGSFTGREVSVEQSEGGRVQEHQIEMGTGCVHILQRDVEVGSHPSGELDLSNYFEVLPEELRDLVAGELELPDLVNLSQTSRMMRDTAVHAGIKQLLGTQEGGDHGLVHSADAKDRTEAANGIGGLLIQGRPTVEERRELLHALVGPDGRGGLAKDPDPEVRRAVLTQIAALLVHDKMSEETRDVLKEVLLGKDYEGGLVRDADPYIRGAAVKVLGSLLLQGGEDLRKAAAGALLGVAGSPGLLQDTDTHVAFLASRLMGDLFRNEDLDLELKNNVLNIMLGDMGMVHDPDPRICGSALNVLTDLLIKGGLSPKLEKQLLSIVIGGLGQAGLIRNGNADIRRLAFGCVGNILCSSRSNPKMKDYLGKLLVNGDGDRKAWLNDGNLDVRRSANELVRNLLKKDSGVDPLLRIDLLNRKGLGA